MAWDWRPGEYRAYTSAREELAKEWAHRLKTPLLLDEYLRASFDALKVVDEVEWKNEEERQAAGQEFEVFMEDYRAVKEDAIGKFADFDAPFCDFLPDYIIALVDGTERNLLAEMMANEFEARKPDDFEAFVLYLYILTILTAQIQSRYEYILYREQALLAWSRMRNECLPYLPDECQSVFQLFIFKCRRSRNIQFPLYLCANLPNQHLLSLKGKAVLADMAFGDAFLHQCCGIALLVYLL